MERHKEDDGFIWYSCTKNGKTVVLNKYKKEIIAPFYGIVSYKEDGYFYTSKFYYNDDRTDSCMCDGIYDKKGNVIISENKGYCNITRQYPFDNEVYYYSTTFNNNGKYYYGIVDSKGNEILEPFSEREISFYQLFPEECWNAPIIGMFVGKVNGERYYTFECFDAAGHYSLLGDPKKKIGLIIEKEEDPESGDWVLSSYRNDGIAYTFYVLDEYLILDSDDHRVGKWAFVKEFEKDEQYFNDVEEELYLGDNTATGLLDVDVWREYSIVNLNFNFPSEIVEERSYQFRITENSLRMNSANDFIRMQNADKLDVTSENVSVPTVNTTPSYYNSDTYIPPVESQTFEDEPRQPIRNRCMSCHRNPGVCSVCEGTRQKKVHYNMSTGEWIMAPCTHCRGTGICPACQGDGWLDEGADF